MRHQQHYRAIYSILLTLGVLLATPSVGFADELDDISIQVIGLDEIPEDALERIPLPSPNFGSLNDIRQNIILNQSADSKIAAPGQDGLTSPPSTDGTATGSQP